MLLLPLSLFPQSSADCANPVIKANIKSNCQGLNNGRLDLVISQGHPPYRIRWQDGSERTYLRNISAGVYQVTVTDALGCVTQSEFRVKAYQPMSATAVVNHTTRTGKHNGAIEIQVNGGQPPYYFTWVSPQGVMSGAESLMRRLPAGDYKITVYDAVHCYSEVLTRIE